MRFAGEGVPRGQHPAAADVRQPAQADAVQAEELEGGAHAVSGHDNLHGRRKRVHDGVRCSTSWVNAAKTVLLVGEFGEASQQQARAGGWRARRQGGCDVSFYLGIWLSFYFWAFGCARSLLRVDDLNNFERCGRKGFGGWVTGHLPAAACPCKRW